MGDFFGDLGKSISNPFQGFVNSAGKVFSNPLKANIGQYVSTFVPVAGSLVVDEIKNPKDAAYHAGIVATLFGGSALLNAWSAAPATPGAGFASNFGAAPVYDPLGVGVNGSAGSLWSGSAASGSGAGYNVSSVGALTSPGASGGGGFSLTGLGDRALSGVETLAKTAISGGKAFAEYTLALTALRGRNQPGGGGIVTVPGGGGGGEPPVVIPGPKENGPQQAGFSPLMAILVVGAALGVFALMRKK